MKKVAAKFVPKLLSDDQKENQIRIVIDLLECVEYNEYFF